MSTSERVRYPIWTRGDLDGFFGLMVDNLVQVLLIIALCTTMAGLPPVFVYTRILPGVAISLLIGNVFYGLQAHWVARRHRNPSCTALPYGINTPSVIAYAYFVMGPMYHEAMADGVGESRAAELAWLAGVAACLVSGLVEFGGAFVAERLRRATPRAALLGVLAAVGITFIASEFAFRIYSKPAIGLLPLGILLLAYFARFNFPLRLPGGFIAIAVGALIAWGMALTGTESFGGASDLSVDSISAALWDVRWTPPQFFGGVLVEALGDTDLVLRFLAVSIPMGLLNLLGALQNIESAEAGGDRFATAPSLAVNGLGSIAAGLFGSCFPTTIYIGHPGWKALGAKSGYSILNGLFFAVCFLFGFGSLLKALIPIEAGAAIVMYIGIIITAQAFQATPKHHAPAVAVSLFPALGALVVMMLQLVLHAVGAGGAFPQIVQAPPPELEKFAGLLTLTGANSSWIVVTLILTAVGAALLDRKYVGAAVWSGVGAVLAFIGLLHAYRLEGNDLREYFIWQRGADFPADYHYRAWPIAVGYALFAALFALAAYWQQRTSRGSATDELKPRVTRDDLDVRKPAQEA